MNKIKEKFVSKLKKMKHYRTNKNITLQEVKQIILNSQNAVLVDVRSIQEYKENHIDGAICIPHYEIQRNIEKQVQNKNTLIILYCQSGTRSNMAMKILEEKGYNNVYQLAKGLDGYIN